MHSPQPVYSKELHSLPSSPAHIEARSLSISDGGTGDLLLCFQHLVPEAGLDEAGRGCLAGPVVAAAVILNPARPIPGLNDSKQLTHEVREELAPLIRERALAWAIASASPEEIGRINILKASFLAMHRAVEALCIRPELLLVDGNRFTPYPLIQHRCVIKGDSIYQNIAAASILAKTHRDALMADLHERYPHYGWRQNKGYPTPEHQRALALHGPCGEHRPGFRLDYK